MPVINNVHHTPAEAIDQGLCPECGRDLKESSFEVETRLHWPGAEDTTTDQTERRYRIALLDRHFNPDKPAPDRPLVLTDAEKAAVLAARTKKE